MYERLEYVEKMLTEYHDGDFKLVKIKANVTVGTEKVDNLTDYIIYRKFMPSARRRFCTALFKVIPIDLFLQRQGECDLLIGLNADEDEDRIGNLEMGKNIAYKYPLVEDELDREDCKELLEPLGLLPDFPAYMSRGGCKYCPFKSKKEFAAMVHLALDEIQEVQALEEYIQDNRNKYYRIRSNMPPLRQFIATEKMNLIGDLSEFYDSGEEQKSCGVFCHR